MENHKPLLPVILSVSMMVLGAGCATLPKVSDVIDEAPARDAPGSSPPEECCPPKRARP